MSDSYDNPLPWKRVWVTGGGRGIGAALVCLFVKRGLTVYASARDEVALQALQLELEQQPGTLIPAPLDIREPDQIRSLVAAWQQSGDFPDLVILNAGTHDPFPVSEFSAQRCQQLLEVNLHGTLNCIEPILAEYQRNNSGHLAVMASVAGYRGLPTAAAYGAGKAALINLCEALYLDLSGSGIKLQVINPGFVRTPLTDKNSFQMPALMEPEDAAEAIVSGLKAERFEISFPSRFVFWLKLLRILPYSWYFKMVRRATGAGQTQSDSVGRKA